MNREILFRGKAINRDNGYHRTAYKNGDWVYGLVTQLYDERYENLPAEMINIDGVSGIEVDYKTVGQYTGLNDKRGVKIFEGDILKFKSGNYVVKWCNDHSKFLQVDRQFSRELFVCIEGSEVIGNIHDNPELMGGKEND